MDQLLYFKELLRSLAFVTTIMDRISHLFVYFIICDPFYENPPKCADITDSFL